jgi:phospholipase A1/A2
MIAIFTVVIFSFNDAAGESLEKNDSMKTVRQVNILNQRQDMNNSENTLSPEKQQKSPQSMDLRETQDSPISTYKVNYFSINQWPGNNNAQVKFQISMKFQVLETNLYIFKYDLFPAYISYTQKSLWNVGQNSMPFEESNYNPTFFLDYPVNTMILCKFQLCDIILSPFEHESNGLAGNRSRSWNRQYVQMRIGLESTEKMNVTNSFQSEKVLLYIKLWHASAYSDQDTYLQSIGNNNKFLDYMGHGEIGISIRNFIWGGILRDHQLDIRTPIFRENNKNSYELEFRQQIPDMNFAIYIQYWYGYGETLLRFDQFGHRAFVGFSFYY